jgi:hypothetical protein
MVAAQLPSVTHRWLINRRTRCASLRIRPHPAGRHSHRQRMAGPFRGRSRKKISPKDGCPGPGLVGRGGVATSIRIKAHPNGRRSHRKGMAGPFRGRSGEKIGPEDGCSVPGLVGQGGVATSIRIKAHRWAWISNGFTKETRVNGHSSFVCPVCLRINPHPIALRHCFRWAHPVGVCLTRLTCRI